MMLILKRTFYLLWLFIKNLNKMSSFFGVKVSYYFWSWKQTTVTLSSGRVKTWQNFSRFYKQYGVLSTDVLRCTKPNKEECCSIKNITVGNKLPLKIYIYLYYTWWKRVKFIKNESVNKLRYIFLSQYNSNVKRRTNDSRWDGNGYTFLIKICFISFCGVSSLFCTVF